MGERIMSVILGINMNHAGASVAIVVDGEVVAAIAEERLNRIKYFAGFPKNAISRCLKIAKLKFKDIDYVAVGRDSKANLRKKYEYALKHPFSLLNLLKIKSSRNELDDLKTVISKECDINIGDLRFKQINVEHHLAHTASAYYTSGWKSAAGLSVDGSGDFVTCMFSKCDGNQIKPVHRIHVPNSLGSFYNMICQFIGFPKYGDEGKVMGLAPYGNDTYKKYFDEMIKFENGQLKLNKKYFIPFGNNQGLVIDDKGEMVINKHYSDYMVQVLGESREPYSEITQRDKDLAFGLQRKFEEIYFKLLNHLYKLVPNEKLVLAGGCALNSVANGKIFEKTHFKKTSIHPASGDEGLAIGAALYTSNNLGEDSKGMKCSYLGSSYSNEEIKKMLEEKRVEFKKLNQKELVEITADKLVEGKIVGWFQGRSEWGPRALGNRSIFCHPGLARMKDILNSRIKHRESFRPFAPIVLADKQSEIFEIDYPSPYMLYVFKIKKEWRNKLSAVNHIDNTGRLQSVSRNENELCYDLINNFYQKTGIPVLLNTSFNENEPIVDNPEEAIDCFLRTKIDVLVIGKYICEK